MFENFLGLIQSDEEENNPMTGGPKKFEGKVSNYVCGMEKKEVFKKAILPVIRTLA